MPNLNAEFKKILGNLEKNMKDKDDLELAKVEIFNLYNLFFDEVSNLESLANSRIAEISQRQAGMEEKLDEIKKEVNNISVDIYGEEEVEDEDYSLTIACPYCNYEFEIDVDEANDIIFCPECNNQIELDWGHDCKEDGCSGCSHNCHYDEDDDI